MQFKYLIFYFCITATSFICSSDWDLDRKHKEAFKRRQLLDQERSQRFSYENIRKKQAIAAQNRCRMFLLKTIKKANYESNYFTLYRMGWLSAACLEKHDYLCSNGLEVDHLTYEEWMMIAERIEIIFQKINI